MSQDPSMKFGNIAGTKHEITQPKIIEKETSSLEKPKFPRNLFNYKG